MALPRKLQPLVPPSQLLRLLVVVVLTPMHRTLLVVRKLQHLIRLHRRAETPLLRA
jgi:hypothetical protein